MEIWKGDIIGLMEAYRKSSRVQDIQVATAVWYLKELHIT